MGPKLFFTMDDVSRLSRVFRQLPHEVSEELRGWRWSEGALIPPYGFKLSASDVGGGFCDTGRHVYMRYVVKAKESVRPKVEKGLFIHEVFSEALRVTKLILYREGGLDGEGFRKAFVEEGEVVLRRLAGRFSRVPDAKEVFDKLWSHAANSYASSLVRARSRSPHLAIDGLAATVVPLVAEFPLDGSLIGLTGAIRVDALLYPSILVEIKTRKLHPDHELGLAAYALAFECQYELPVDYAVLVNVRVSKSDFKVYERILPLSDGVRQRFVERRDALARIVEERLDPGRPVHCSPDCPFLEACAHDQ
ncbi:MAG: type I-A CRISPR-associated protein Cas4/Csa1 [Candidatus Nezhaarchaeota archaeon]|nr:type I-A CRISPR-associated protein Cas4/Csa1 [Candidatus Nezhaarchaeota archaeon]